MYRAPDGTEYYIVDGHVHFWDASPANQLNRYGEGFIGSFYDYHRALSPPEYLWPREKFERYGEETMMRDVFAEGHVDVAILQPTYLTDFYRDGFNTTAQDAVLKERHPQQFVLNSSFEPRDEQAGLDRFVEKVKRWNVKGVKLYTAEWRGDSRGWKLTDPWARRYLDKCVELGVLNIHVHKGPTIWPLNKDAFDLADVDAVATDYLDAGLRFIVEHCGLPRIEDFNWIAVQEPNVYAGLAVFMPFIHARPRYFAEVLAELLWWVGEDRMLYASDYAIWSPRWIVERFAAFELPEDLRAETGVELSIAAKRKIFGLNAARLYDLEVPAHLRLEAGEPALSE